MPDNALSPTAGPTGHTALIAVADRHTRETLMRVLHQRGCSTLIVTTGDEAWDALKHDRPELIVIGDLPDTATAIFVERLRTIDGRVPILVIGTGHPRCQHLLATHTVQAILPTVEETALQQALDACACPAPQRPPSRWAATILIVDDEPKLRRILADFLDVQGFCVVTAASGEEALAHAARLTPTLILLDIKLPGLSGIATLRQLKALHPAVPVLMLTGLEEERVMHDALALGAQDYLLKPFDLEYLRTTVLTKILLGTSAG